MEISRLEGIIEAILFTMGDSVELSRIAAAIEHDEDTTRKIDPSLEGYVDSEEILEESSRISIKR